MGIRTLDEMDSVDWSNLEDVSEAGEELLSRLDRDRIWLGSLVDHAIRSPDLFAMCEHYDILDKIILHEGSSGWRLRLHVFGPGYFDRPHNHRWTYSSRIIHGRYRHTLYGTDEQLEDEAFSVATLKPVAVRTEREGDTYTLHHSMIHSVTAAPFTTSVVVRGPAESERFLVMDRPSGAAWWQFGAARESKEEASLKRMSVDRATECLRTLQRLRVVED